MCGIYGVVEWKGQRTPDERQVAVATDRMADRGPDGRGLLLRPGVGLGHRRLAIIDIEGGAQPLLSDDGRRALVYNGEIYNAPQLRTELEAAGQRFRSRCDTEVVLRAHEVWGDAACERLRGMFAYGLVELESRRVLLVRDRLGVKPLYFYEGEGRLVFASELGPIVETPGVSRAPDIPAISHYLSTLQPTMGARTLYEKVRILQAGERLVARPGAPSVCTRWWDITLRDARDDSDPGEATHIQRVAAAVEDSVRAHLPADRPVGCFLSGGLDSTIIASVAHEALGERPAAGTVGFVDPSFHEFPFARGVAEHHASHLEEVLVDDREFFDLLPRMIARRAAPLTTPNEIPMFCLSRRIREQFPVALTGEGADELFAGYGAAYRAAHDFERACALANGGQGYNAEERAQITRALRQVYGTDRFSGPVDHFLALLQWVPFGEKATLLSDDALDAIHGDRETIRWYAELFEAAARGNAYDQLLYVHARTNLHGLLLRVDSATMAAGVEARVPFCDVEVAEAAFAIPYQYKLRWNSPEAEAQARTLPLTQIAGKLDTTKYVLRQAFAERVGETVLNREKRSFPVPIEPWLRGAWRLWSAERILDCGPLRQVFEDEALVSVVQGDDPRTPYRLWPILNLALWFDYTEGRQQQAA